MTHFSHASEFGTSIANRTAKRAPLRRKPKSKQVSLTNLSNFFVSITDDLESIQAEWRQLEQISTISVYQRFDWVSAYLDSHTCGRSKPKANIVVIHYDGELVMILPFMYQPGLVKKLQWFGGSHSNYNMPLISDRFRTRITGREIRHIFKQISKMMPGISFLKLCNQPLRWEGQDNPLIHLAHQPSPHMGYQLHLYPDFDRVLSQSNAKRKKKKFRYQSRQAEAHGGAELVIGDTQDTARELLESFFEQKSQRMKRQGLKDLFDREETRQFFRKLSDLSVGTIHPPLIFYGLRIGGKIRAVYGGSIWGERFSANVSSFSEDELAHISPGEMLMYMMSKHLSEQGLTVMDLGIGEERYKTSWCPEHIIQFDTVMALSPLAWVHTTIHRLGQLGHIYLRNNRFVWCKYRTVRKQMAQK